MNARIIFRRIVVASAFAAITVLSACAVTTAPFSPTRATLSNRSMTSQYDVLRMQGPTKGLGKMTTAHDGALFEFRYY